MSDIQQYMAPEFQEAASAAKLVPTKTADVKASYDMAAARAAASERASAAKAKLAEMGYGKPARDRNDSGGYTFYDDKGKPISAAEYSALTGDSIDKVLEGSLDQNDIKFTQEYSMKRQYIQNPAQLKDDLTKIQDVLDGKSTEVIIDDTINDPNDPRSRAYWDQEKAEREGLLSMKPLDIMHDMMSRYEPIFFGYQNYNM